MSRDITATCQTCDCQDSLTVDAAKHDSYLMREGLVQQMFPALDKEQREIIINADAPHQRAFGYYVCATCWPIVMGEDED